ncbi:MAG: BamA/TamA family outer membrane protein [Myxococcota bacterium]
MQTEICRSPTRILAGVRFVTGVWTVWSIFAEPVRADEPADPGPQVHEGRSADPDRGDRNPVSNTTPTSDVADGRKPNTPNRTRVDMIRRIPGQRVLGQDFPSDSIDSDSTENDLTENAERTESSLPPPFDTPFSADAVKRTDTPKPRDQSEDPSMEPAEDAMDSEKAEDLEWLVLPLIGFDSDRGFGAAILALVFVNEEGLKPYRDRFFAVSTGTHRLIQTHLVEWERVRPLGLPIRIQLGFLFDANPVDNFCGFGNGVSCDRSQARDAAEAAGMDLESGEGGAFVDNYYRVRYMRYRGSLRLSYEGFDVRALQLSAEWRGTFNEPGFFGTHGAYQGSLFDQSFPDGDRGFQSELRIGLVLDRRDHERRPSSGYVLGGSVRASQVVFGSDWDYLGTTLVGATYTSLDRKKRFVLANRLVWDLLAGEPPAYVLGSVGGFWQGIAFGGSQMGRGIRQRRFIGRIKGIAQSELRTTLFGQPERFQLASQLYVDGSWIGVDFDEFGGSVRRVVTSFGGGLNAAWGQNFVVRFDVGLSGVEGFRPKYYLMLAHPY